MDVLLSIKPKYADKIFSGEKIYEYRRAVFSIKNFDIEKDVVVVYASSPVRKIIGEFKVWDILTHPKEIVWSTTHHRSGLNKTDFDNYFKGKACATYITIAKTQHYKEPKPLSDYGISRPPQNFMYLR